MYQRIKPSVTDKTNVNFRQHLLQETEKLFALLFETNVKF